MFSDADFSGSQYGGGYMQNESGMGNMVSPSPAKRKVVDQCLLPCTIKQILLAPEPKADENLSIDGRELSNVSIIGSILQIDVQSTHVTYRLDDGSGAIDVKVWSGDGDQSKQPQLEDLKLSSYIRVIGRVQAFKGKRSITGFALVPLLDMNELTLHFLECIYAHLYNTTSSKKLDFGNSNNNDVDMMDVSMKKTQISASRNNFSNNTMDTSVPEGSWSDLEKKIFRFINQPDIRNTEEGASVEQIFTAMNDEDVNDIREAIERLSSEGQLYTTIDEEHYKCTTS